jgi:glycosyltransferase involved in cell wall biosynthesis
MLIYLYIGRLSHVKGVDILLQAWSTLPRTIQEKSFLVIIGDGSEKKTLHQMCRNYNIAETVSILGSKQEVRDFYQAADVFILPSRTEGLSNALLEAMSSSLPVIASRVGGTPDIVTEGDEGFLFTAGNYLECATRIETLYSASELRNKMGRKARQKVIVCSDMTDLALRFKEIYITL